MMGRMSIRTSPQFGSNLINEVCNAATTSQKSRSTGGRRLSMRTFDLRAAVLLSRCSDCAGNVTIGSNGNHCHGYEHKLVLIDLLFLNITMYKKQYYNVGYNLIFIFGLNYISVTKLTCNFIADSAHFLYYILSSRRRS